MKKNIINPFFIILIILILLIFFHLYLNKEIFKNNDNSIKNATNNWINAVTINNNPKEVASLFCEDGVLIGTVSQIKRKGVNIERYFDYFAKLPNIQVVSRKYKISKIDNTIYVNNALIIWKWDGLDEPVTARMTFIFRIENGNPCIFLLNSSVLPDVNDDLLRISGRK